MRPFALQYKLSILCLARREVTNHYSPTHARNLTLAENKAKKTVAGKMNTLLAVKELSKILIGFELIQGGGEVYSLQGTIWEASARKGY